MYRLQRFIPDIRSATFFDIQNVSDYFWQNQKEFYDLVEMNLAPPYDFFATRYVMPDQIYSKERGYTTPLDADAEILTVFNVIERTLPQIDNMKWFLDIRLFAARGQRVILLARWTACVDPLGQLAKQPDGRAAFFLTSTTSSESVSEHLIGFLHVSGLALTFLHCKNVEILPAYADKGRKKPKKRDFGIKYHRLKVHAIGGQKQYEGDDPKRTGIKQGLSITRGHFKTYGPEFGKGKLFGKLSGRFWVAAHLKGNIEQGIITKDYKIK